MPAWLVKIFNWLVLPVLIDWLKGFFRKKEAEKKQDEISEQSVKKYEGSIDGPSEERMKNAQDMLNGQ